MAASDDCVLPERGRQGTLLERLLTVNQLAELWQLHPRTIRRMIADGRIPVRRFGRAVRIHPDVARKQKKGMTKPTKWLENT
jgi:excisionase family DNA binding protein